MSAKTPLPPKPDDLPGRGSIWQHSKGTFYRVVGYSRHSENPAQWLVTYRPVTGEGDDWTRALLFTNENAWSGFLDSFTIPAFEGDDGWHRFKHVGGPRTWKDEETFTPSGGNVFEDLGLPDARIDAMPPEVESDEEKATKLLALCRTFIETQSIGCVETVYQTDRVAENATDFIAGICEIVGYKRDEI